MQNWTLKSDVYMNLNPLAQSPPAMKPLLSVDNMSGWREGAALHILAQYFINFPSV